MRVLIDSHLNKGSVRFDTYWTDIFAFQKIVTMFLKLIYNFDKQFQWALFVYVLIIFNTFDVNIILATHRYKAVAFFADRCFYFCKRITFSIEIIKVRLSKTLLTCYIQWKVIYCFAELFSISCRYWTTPKRENRNPNSFLFTTKITYIAAMYVLYASNWRILRSTLTVISGVEEKMNTHAA